MRKALGRGLEALLPASPARRRRRRAGRRRSPVAASDVPVGEITPNPDQPRRRFDPEALAALAESIRRHGLLQPLVGRGAPSTATS